MTSPRFLFASSISLLTFYFAHSASRPAAGFFLPDSVMEMTLEYKAMRNLIILPVTINDSVKVNLIVDTGCRNLILFGKRFSKRLRITPGKTVAFSGLGDGRSVKGKLSLGNKVCINQVLGEQIPVVVVENNNLFANYNNVHGVIGYDIFVKFEVEINARKKTITFRPAMKSKAPAGYTQIPLRIIDAKPVMKSEVYLNGYNARSQELMIDTGSSLGLLLKTTTIEDFAHHDNTSVLGVGFNGPVSGYHIISKKVKMPGMEMHNVATGIVSSAWHDNASIGMEVLKDYVMILNYCKAYACFKPTDA